MATFPAVNGQYPFLTFPITHAFCIAPYSIIIGPVFDPCQTVRRQYRDGTICGSEFGVQQRSTVVDANIV